MSESKMPNTDSILELAHFWDTHDVTEFEEELEEVSNSVFERRDVLRVPLAAGDMDALRRLAKSRDVPVSELVLSWVKDRLRAS